MTWLEPGAERDPLGVPSGYSVTRLNPVPEYVDPFTFNPNRQQGPRYFEGDELSPGGASVDDIVGLQQQLADAGWLGKYIIGVWDDASINAYARAMAAANRMGVTVEELLASGGGSSDGSGRGSGAAAPKLPNPEDVKALLNDAAYKQIGKNLDTAALDAGVQAFYNAYKPSGPYQAPDAGTIADNYLKSSMPDEVAAHGTTRVFDIFSKMLGGI